MEPEKNNNLYDRSFRASIAVGLLATLFTALLAGPEYAIRYAIFVAWTLINLIIWRYSLREILGRQRFFQLFLLIPLKIYWIVVLVVLALSAGIGEKIGYFLAFLLGFNTPFLVLSLKALGSTQFRSAKSLESRAKNRPPNPTDEQSILDK